MRGGTTGGVITISSPCRGGGIVRRETPAASGAETPQKPISARRPGVARRELRTISSSTAAPMAKRVVISVTGETSRRRSSSRRKRCPEETAGRREERAAQTAKCPQDAHVYRLPQLRPRQHPITVAILVAERRVVAAPLAAGHDAVAVAIEAVEARGRRRGVPVAVGENSVVVAVETLECRQVAAPFGAGDLAVAIASARGSRRSGAGRGALNVSPSLRETTPSRWCRDVEQRRVGPGTRSVRSPSTFVSNCRKLWHSGRLFRLVRSCLLLSSLCPSRGLRGVATNSVRRQRSWIYSGSCGYRRAPSIAPGATDQLLETRHFAAESAAERPREAACFISDK